MKKLLDERLLKNRNYFAYVSKHWEHFGTKFLQCSLLEGGGRTALQDRSGCPQWVPYDAERRSVSRTVIRLIGVVFPVWEIHGAN